MSVREPGPSGPKVQVSLKAPPEFMAYVESQKLATPSRGLTDVVIDSVLLERDLFRLLDPVGEDLKAYAASRDLDMSGKDLARVLAALIKLGLETIPLSAKVGPVSTRKK